MIKVILFDLDGTIIDSEPMSVRAVTEMGRKWNIEIDPADSAFVAGKKWDVAFELLFKKYQFPVPRTEVEGAILSHYTHLVKSEVKAVPGAVDAIRDFSQHYQLGLVSGSFRSDVLWALQSLKIDNYFKVILGAEDYPLSKPAPDGFKKAMEFFGIEPKFGLVFEDSNAGIASAKSAGLKVVALESTNHFSHDQSAADKKIWDFSNIKSEWVKKSFSPIQ